MHRQRLTTTYARGFLLLLAAGPVRGASRRAAGNSRSTCSSAAAGWSTAPGNPWVRADVAVRGDRIARIGHLPDATADRTIDAEGLVVAPGFVDPHTHAVRGIFDVPTADNYLLQGVTTLTEGNDGSSPWPIGEHLEQIAELGISPNWGVFAGQGTIRREVIGSEDRDPTRDELDRMRALVAEAMQEGAFGLSTGLFYVPGSFTSTEEVIELSKIAASHGGIYISHMRDEALRLLDSVRETIRIGEEAGIPVQMTHHKAISRDMWGRSADSLALVDAARARGVDITIDQYPYTASQTGITAVVPQWAQAGGTQELIARLQDPETRRRIRGEIVYRIEHDRGRRRSGEHRHRPLRMGPLAGGQEPRRHPRRAGDRGDGGERRRPGHGDRRARRRPGHLPRDGRARRRAHHAAPGHRHRLRRRASRSSAPACPTRASTARSPACPGPLRARARRADARAGGAQDERGHRPPARPAGPGPAARGLLRRHRRLRSRPRHRPRDVPGAAPVRRGRRVRAGQRHAGRGRRRAHGRRPGRVLYGRR